jgi:predicted esterase
MSMNSHANGAVLHAGAPLSDAALAVVLLHGRGGSAEDILGLASAFNLADVAYIAPQAAGHTWYPQSFLAPRQDNEPYLSSALAKVEAILRSIEQAGVQRNRIVIAGFSQGACLSTEFVASYPARYGGLIAFTGGLIGAPGTLHFGDESDAKSALASTPALFCSGDPDPHVPWKRVEESASILSAMGAVVTTRRYPGRPHTISAEELALGRSFLETARSQQQQHDRSK